MRDAALSSLLALFATSLLLSLRAAAFVVQPGQRPAKPCSALLFAEKNPVPTRSKLTPAERLMRKNMEAKGQQPQDTKNGAPFDKVKEAVYTVGDGLGKINTPKQKTDKVYDGYKGATKDRSPTQQILQTTLKKLKKPDTSAPPVKEFKPKPSVFDSVKETIYGTADLVSKPKKSTKAKSPIQQIEFKPATSKERSVPDSVIDSLPDLQSNNPLKRTAAELKIRNAEIKEKTKQTQQTIEGSVEAAKEAAYKTGEFFQTTASEIEKLPDKSQKFANDVTAFFEAIPVFFKETVDIFASIPVEAERRISETYERTVKVVEEVKAIPTKVQTTTEKTANSVKQTVDGVKAIPTMVKTSTDNTVKTAKDTVDKTVQFVNDVKAFPSRVQQSVEDFSYNTKVLLGKEKPKPPPPPPPPKDAGEIAGRIAGSVLKGVGDAAWWVTKGVAQLAWKAVEAGVKKVQEQLNQQQQKQSSVVSTSAAKSVKSPPPRPSKPSAPNAAATVVQKPPPPPPAQAKTKKDAPPPPPKPPVPVEEATKPKAETPPPVVPPGVVEKDLETPALDAEIAAALEAAKSALKEDETKEDKKD